MGWLNKEEMEKMLDDLEVILNNNDIECMCGNEFLADDLRVSENYSKDYGQEFWIYAHCDKCEYDYNYEKILRQYRRFKLETN